MHGQRDLYIQHGLLALKQGGQLGIAHDDEKRLPVAELQQPPGLIPGRPSHGCIRVSRYLGPIVQVSNSTAVAAEKRKADRDWDYWGKPICGFGDARAWLWIVGLAPDWTR